MRETPKLPAIDTPQFHSFIQALKNEDVRPAAGLQALSQSNDGHYIEVDTIRDGKYKADHCWYNAKRHALENNGEVIFGWALWQLANDKFVAQHHAIYKSVEGRYLDVTLGNRGLEKIVFFIDNRAPFDYRTLKGPPNFEYVHGQRNVWYTQDTTRFEFFIAVLTPNDYVKCLIEKWQRDGVL